MTEPGDDALVFTVWLMVVPLPPEKPEVPGVPLATQENEAPETSAESARLNGAPEQRVEANGETVTEGFGYTVTLKFTGPFVHPFSSMFTAYTTLRVTFFVIGQSLRYYRSRTITEPGYISGS